MEYFKALQASAVPCFRACLSQLFLPYHRLPSSEPQAKAAEDGLKCHECWRDLPLVQEYDVLKKIGRGGFSEIWLAAPRAAAAGARAKHGPASPSASPAPSPPLPPARRVVLKVVNLAHPDLEPEEVTTLMSEAKYLRSLDCPHLPRCYAAEVGPPGCARAPSGDGRAPSAAAARGPPAPPLRRPRVLVLALEHLAGGELLEGAARVARYTEARAAGLFAQAVAAVAYLHALNIMHRDIKPENIVFVEPVEAAEAGGRPLRVKVIDLGMAAQYDPKEEIRGCLGTPGFVAPELWHDEPHTPAADVYSLGIVLFVMLTGRKPHAGRDIRTMAYCDKPIAQAPGLQDERFLALSPAARELLLAMLADDPLRRPSAAALLRHPFLAAAEGGGAGAGGDSAQREMGEVVRRRMRELAQLRRAHGLRFALRAVRRPDGSAAADYHIALLADLERRRLRLKSPEPPEGADDDAGPFNRPSHSSGGGGGGPFARSSLAASFAAPLPVVVLQPSRPPSAAAAAAAGPAAGLAGWLLGTRGRSAHSCSGGGGSTAGGGSASAGGSPFSRGRGLTPRRPPTAGSAPHSRGSQPSSPYTAAPSASLLRPPRRQTPPPPPPPTYGAAPPSFGRASAPANLGAPAGAPHRTARAGRMAVAAHAAAVVQTPPPPGQLGSTTQHTGSGSGWGGGGWPAARAPPRLPANASESGWRPTHGSGPVHTGGIPSQAPTRVQEPQQGAASALFGDGKYDSGQRYQSLQLEQQQQPAPQLSRVDQSPLIPHPSALLHRPFMPSPGLDAGGGLPGGGSPAARPGMLEAAMVARHRPAAAPLPGDLRPGTPPELQPLGVDVLP